MYNTNGAKKKQQKYLQIYNLFQVIVKFYAHSTSKWSCNWYDRPLIETKTVLPNLSKLRQLSYNHLSCRAKRCLDGYFIVLPDENYFVLSL